jgi:hypothetical protein
MKRRNFILLAMTAIVAPIIAVDGVEARKQKKSKGRGSKRSGSGGGTYANCAQARAAGAAPIRRGEAGYSRKLDRDGDGIACE